ncbi:unnamed protein product [Amoebophrya sp. A25]|nr:unnamed protein product [Amoebophrya sp. A25]|eukprot:GSA25T00014774001.1
MDSAVEMKTECGTVVQQGPPAMLHMITGNSEATSSSNTQWDLFRPRQGAGAVVYSCKPLARILTGKKGPIRKKGRASGRPGSGSVCRASRRRAVGSAILCLGAVRALHRDSKDQERAITSTQVPGSPAVQGHFGPGAEMTPETTQSAALGEHGEDHGSKSNAGKHKDVGVASQIIADAEHQGRASGSEVPLDHADTRDDHRTAKHEEVELGSAGKDDEGEVSTGGKKTKIGKYEIGQRPLHQIAAPLFESVALDTHGEWQARHESHNTTIEDAARYQSEEYLQQEEPISSRQGSQEKHRESDELRQSVKERQTSGGALRPSKSVIYSSEASGSGTGRGLDYAADLDITVESDLDLILLHTSAASGWTIAGQLGSIWRRIVSFFSSVSAPPEADDLGSSGDDVEFTALRNVRRMYAAPGNQSSLLEVRMERLANGAAAQAVTNQINEIRRKKRCQYNLEQIGQHSLAGITLVGKTATHAAVVWYYCECGGSTAKNWQFITLAAAGENGSPALSCWIHAVATPQKQIGGQNDGIFLVRSEPLLNYQQANSPGLGTDGEASAGVPIKDLFCKKLPHSIKVDDDDDGKKAAKEAKNGSECAAAADFVEEWGRNVAKQGSRSIDLTTPFCKQLSKVIDVGTHTALCMDAMHTVSNSALLTTLASQGGTATGAAKEQGPHQNVLASTWESIRLLERRKLFHRDIKAANFLSVSQAHDQQRVMWMASDFGFACSYSEQVTSVAKCKDHDESGTLGYLSPDHLTGGQLVQPAARAARGDSFSWSVMIVDGARAQCGDPSEMKEPTGFSEMLGFKAEVKHAEESVVDYVRGKHTICPKSSILVQMSQEKVQSAADAGELLLKWIAGNEKGANKRDAHTRCQAVLVSLQSTMLMPLERPGSHADLDKPREKPEAEPPGPAVKPQRRSLSSVAGVLRGFFRLGDARTEIHARGTGEHERGQGLRPSEVRPSLPPKRRGPVRAIDLMASALLGDPWIEYESTLEKNYKWRAYQDRAGHTPESFDEIRRDDCKDGEL